MRRAAVLRGKEGCQRLALPFILSLFKPQISTYSSAMLDHYLESGTEELCYLNG
jgi:hypothetical protein